MKKDQVPTEVSIGGASIGEHIDSLRVTQKLNDLSSAEVKINKSIINEKPLDYCAPVVIKYPTSEANPDGVGQHGPLFAGVVEKATVSDDSITLECQGHFGSIKDSAISSTVTNMHPLEQVYFLVRSTGLSPEQIRIEGIEEFPKETFEILAPIKGVVVESATRIGDVVLLPPNIKNFEKVSLPMSDTRIEESFMTADCHAIHITDENLVYEAEKSGSQSIDDTLAWLALRSHDGSSHDYNRLIPFHRDATLALPRRMSVIATRGLSTNRRMIRDQDIILRETELNIDHMGEILLPRFNAQKDNMTLHAIRAWYRARRSNEPLGSILALWDAVEFYTSGSKPPKIFNKEEARELRKEINTLSKKFSHTQAQRINSLYERLNEAPLVVKFKHQMNEEGVLFSEADIDNLLKLRKIRNNAVHGRGVGYVRHEDLKQGISFLARVITNRFQRKDGPPWVSPLPS